ncbi:hypothetical protein WICPIJ_008664 [Wickerhamomyces pijperi]|uniref:MATE efflux family protein n=1 Tax=Wickerhamomyces pijperi TaxID=599730 RepID=A0A9P8PX93_WICPI|nr:hypothetical protein WICPIJ_008664 [Wickerhamomyces pijperi]
MLIPIFSNRSSIAKDATNEINESNSNIYHGHHRNHIKLNAPPPTASRQLFIRRAGRGRRSGGIFPHSLTFTPFTTLTHPIAQRLLQQTQLETQGFVSTKGKLSRRQDDDNHSFRSFQEHEPLIPSIPVPIPVNHTAIQSETGQIYGSQLSRVISMPSETDISNFVQSSPAALSGHLEWIKGVHQRRYSTVNNDVDDKIPLLLNKNNVNESTLHLQHNGYGSFEDDIQGDRTRRDTELSEYQDLIQTVRLTKQTYLQDANSSLEDFSHELVTNTSESLKLARYAIPLILTFLLDQSFQFVSIIIVGHLGTNQLAAISLATMVGNIIFSVFEGISTALDTLCPQAYGAGDLIGVGVHFQRCTIMSLAIWIPFAFLWWYTGELLSWIVDDAEVVQLTSLYQHVTIIAMPGFIGFETTKRFLQAQGLFDAGTYVLLITMPLNCLISYLLVVTYNFGFIGAAIATNINAWTQVLFLLAYVYFIDGSKCWGGFNINAFSHWSDLFQLSLPGMLMFLIESLLYESMTLIATQFGTKYLAIQTTATTITSLLYTIPFSIGIASSTRIANFIGAERPKAAQKSTDIAMVSSVLVGLLNTMIIFLFPSQITKLFTSDSKIIDLTIALLPLVAISQVFDSVNAVAGGCLRGQGMQRIGSIITLVGYIGVGVPFGYGLSYRMGLKLQGLWYTNVLVLACLGICSAWWCLFGVSWEVIMQEAKLREMEVKEASSADVSDYEDDDYIIGV